MFSIIVPCYNSQEFIYRALKSIVQQTYKDYELIIIDDGSKDNGKQVIEDFIEKHKDLNLNIKFFSTENRGLGPARNLGIDNATKDYLWFIDADDFLIDDKCLEDAANIIKENNYPDMLITGVFETDFKNRNKIWQFTKKDKLTTIKKDPLLYLKQNWVWNKPVKREVLNSNNIRFGTERFEDIYFNGRVFPKLKNIYITRRIVNVYVKHDKAATASLKTFKSYPTSLIHAFNNMIKTIIKKES